VQVRGHVAPAQDVLALLRDDVLEQELARAALPRIRREEEHADRVAAGTRQLDAELLDLAAEELVRELDDDARAVAAARVAPDRAAVRQVVQQRQALAYDLVRGRAAHVRDEPDAARVALVSPRIVQPLLLRQSVVHVSGAPHVWATYEEAPPNRWSGGAVAPNRYSATPNPSIPRAKWRPCDSARSSEWRR
jgi:hypothetical protein